MEKLESVTGTGLPVDTLCCCPSGDLGDVWPVTWKLVETTRGETPGFVVLGSAVACPGAWLPASRLTGLMVTLWLVVTFGVPGTDGS